MVDKQITGDSHSTLKNFDVLFYGQIQQGRDMGEVRERIGEVFNLTPDRLERLFAADVCYLKRNIDYAMAIEIKSLVASAGAVAEVQLAEARFTMAPLGADVLVNQADPSLATQIHSQQLANLDTQPPGSDLLAVGERLSVSSVEIDTSHLKLLDPFSK